MMTTSKKYWLSGCATLTAALLGLYLYPPAPRSHVTIWAEVQGDSEQPLVESSVVSEALPVSVVRAPSAADEHGPLKERLKSRGLRVIATERDPETGKELVTIAPIDDAPERIHADMLDERTRMAMLDEMNGGEQVSITSEEERMLKRIREERSGGTPQLENTDKEVL